MQDLEAAKRQELYGYVRTSSRMSAATLCTPEAVREVMNTLSPDLQLHNQLLDLMQDHSLCCG